MGDRIGRSAPRSTAPVETRDRLFQAIARARTATVASPRIARRRGVATAGIAALVFAGLGLAGYPLLRDWTERRVEVDAVMEDQLRSRNGGGLVSSDSLQVAGWLAERLPFAVQVPLFPQARLVGARILVVDRGKRGAVLEYSAGGRSLSYYVLPVAGSGLPGQVRITSRDGYRVASWHDAGLTHALAATLPGPRLIEYARYCMHQMMAG